MISRAPFGIVLSIGAVLFAIWPNNLPLQQHLAMAQIVPGSARIAPSNQVVPGNTTAGAQANTTAGAPAHAANTDPGDPGGEEVVPHWYGGAPCPDNGRDPAHE